MDPNFYDAAVKGNTGVFENIHRPLDGLLTVNKNTILHISISSILAEEELTKEKLPVLGGKLDSAENFVKVVLDKCPSLLLKANAEYDTPLHVAARYGHASIVKILIEHKKSRYQDLESGVLIETTKDMIGKLNKERDTALHEAVRHNHIEVVKQLLMELEPEFPLGANVAGETPLYVAAERHFPDLVSKILDKFKSPNYDGPLGRTALHAAASWNDEGMIRKILEGHGHLCTQADEKGWTPLHVAAYMGSIEPTKLLLESNREVAYMKDAEGRTALHIAAHCNNDGVTKEILSMCPDCCEVVDNEGRNALHLAVKCSSPAAALIIQNHSSILNLLNQKDNEGNSPLHHYCNSLTSSRYNVHVLNSPRVDKMAFNKMNQNAYQILTSNNFPNHKKHIFENVGVENDRFKLNRRVLEIGYDEIEKKNKKLVQKEDEEQEEEKVKNEKKMEEEDKAAQAHLVVAALITTLSFAAGITMPGGFIGGDDKLHPGTAVLRKSVAFKAFIITNTLSMMLSSSAVFIHLFIPLIPSSNIFGMRSRLLKMAFRFLILAMTPMVLAFVTGTYAVLAHSDIAIPNCVICLSFVPILFYIFLTIRLFTAYD